ncbi:MAG: hypothetical protein Q8796_02130, partial [Candidatus Phytoplasma australasiaticum]|nr:hypothetical protein [Candidatus Phytoplasma australasiaticum]
MIWILIAILLGSLSIFLLVYFRFVQNKKIITLIISIFILIMLWTFIKHYQKNNNDLNEQNKNVLTLGLTSPVQDGFGIFGQGANTVINSHIRDLLHEYLIKAYPSSFGQHTRSNDVGRGMTSSPVGSTHVRATSGVA